MNVWIKKCRKQAACNHCPKPILNGEYMVMCTYYKKTSIKNQKTGEKQIWRFRLRFHPQCWIDQGIAALKKRGDIPETRGRKKLDLRDGDNIARLKILRRRAAVMQRLKIEMSRPQDGQNIDRIIHLGGLLNKLKAEIEPFGGAPESWE